jgi:hypothetical protein
MRKRIVIPCHRLRSMPLKQIEHYLSIGARFSGGGTTEWLRNFVFLARLSKKQQILDIPEIKGISPYFRNWLHYQRRIRTRLKPERRKLLNSIGFSLSWHEATWMKHYEDLKAFKMKHKRLKVGKNHPLSRWMNHQREFRETLSPVQSGLLRNLGFEWKPLDAAWEKRFEELKRFKAQFGHLRVPQNGKYARLNNWVNIQRKILKNQKRSDRKDRLVELGLPMEAKKALIEKRVEQVKDFKRVYGHLLASPKYKHPGVEAIHSLRWRYRRGTLPVKVQRELETLGLDLYPSGSRFLTSS